MKTRNPTLGNFVGKCNLHGRILLSLVLIRLRLRTFGYKSIERSTVKVSSQKTPIDPVRVSRIVARIAKFVPGALCLCQAIVAQRQSARFGYETTIKVGVKSNAQSHLLAHAWLIYEKRVVLGGSDAEMMEYDVIKEMTSATT